ncbi:MAG: desulfoferrodoxin [Planctomycetota bacterium]|jgi:superoxide reductase
MAERLEVYKCVACGNIVEVLDGGEGTLVCCDEPMQRLEEKTADKTVEKHVPVIERVDGGIRVVVGSTPHPMTAEHWIQWIELLADGKAYRQFLTPGDEPEAVFAIEAEVVSAREHCNVHGLWKG